jgi:hypothetical protein
MRLALSLMMLLFASAAQAGSAQWHEYRTKHFLVWTDLSPDRAQLLVKRLETVHLLEIKAMVGEEVEIPGRLRVLAFAQRSDFRDLVGSTNAEGFFTSDHFGDPTIVFPVEGFVANPVVIAHEVVHYLAWYIYPRQPHWFSEGIAQFYETVAIDSSGEDRSELGSHIRHATGGASGAAGFRNDNTDGQLYYATQVPVAELLKWNGVEDKSQSGRYHFWSWALYHYLWNKNSKQFTQYQQSLGDGGDPDVAWRAAFPEFDPGKPGATQELDAELLQYCKSGRYTFYRVTGEGDATFTERALSTSDLQLALVDVRMDRPNEAAARAAARRRDLEAVLKDNPGNPLAVLLLASEAPGGSVSDAMRAAAAARPGDWRGWLLLGEALRAPAEHKEKEAALRKAVQLNPDNAQAQNAVAWLLVSDARAKEALPFANRAADLAPWDPGTIDTLARIANALGKCPAALVLQRRAVALDDKNEGLKKTLAEYESHCGARAGGAAAPTPGSPATPAAPTAPTAPAAPAR